MDIRDFVSRLHVESGPNAKGEYMCRCPAHEDRSASLSVGEGARGILLYCHTGKCSAGDIVEAMGLTLKDLRRDGGTGGGGVPARGRGATASPGGYDGLVPGATVYTVGGRKDGGRQNAAPAEAGSQKERGGKAPGEFVCAYPYTGEEGRLLYEACRYERADGKKTFRMRQPDPDKPGAYKYTKAGVRLVLYRLPEVLAAIQGGKPVFLCEGEKDCDNMAALGYAATTSPMGAGKWGAGDYAPSLAGAELYIIPDNDRVGFDHAEEAARSAAVTAKTVRVLDLARVFPALPTKGDISDFYKMLGRKAGDEALAKLMTETAPYVPDAPSGRDLAAEQYGKIFGYRVDRGRICQETQEGPKPLANFVALPVAVVERDDGVTQVKEMVFDGWSADGGALPRVRIKANQFNTMNWVAEYWDFAAGILPGTATKDRLRYVITEVGRVTAERVTQYTHTGWRRIGGKWAYLYQGGAIGADWVTVDLGSGLSSYRLDGSGADGFDRISYREGAMTVLRLMGCMADHVGMPLLGTLFLAPLREFLAATGVGPAYALFLLGGTGTRKSTAAALGLSLFGDFTARSLPASFNDTANFIRKKAFLLKDAPIVVDDYHPVTSLVERKKMEATAQSLARAFGDGAERGRMKSDLSLQEAMPPRGVAIISGEDLPSVGQSGLERFYIVHVKKNEIPVTEGLTEVQELARQGYLQKAMRGYIKWLLKQADELPGMLHDDFMKNRSLASNRMRDEHGRPSEAIAHMMLGYQCMLRYMRDVEAITTEEAEQMLTEAWEVTTADSRRQADDMREERPSRLFLASVSELLVSKAAGVVDLTAPEGRQGAGGREMIGYMDANFYYLMPNVAYRSVAKLCNEQGQAFPLTVKMLYKQMREDGILTPETTTATSATRPMWVEGRSLRLLWVPRNYIDGPGVRYEQQKMETGGEGYEVVEDEEMPF